MRTAVVECLRGVCAEVVAEFDGGETDWMQGILNIGTETPLILERFLSTEEGIRTELNSWAAFLETREDNPHHVVLMERMIQTSQLFTLCVPSEAGGQGERVGRGLCQFLAQSADGVYQADDEGFHSADGELLVPED